MRVIFEQLRCGGDRNFGYLLADRDAGVGVLIDPSYTPEAFVDRARAQRIAVTHVINTHGHPDHINGNERAVTLTNATIAAHPLLRPGLALGDGDELAVGMLRLRVTHVSGHSADHIVLYEPALRLLVTGDLIFVGKVGGTASDEDARTEWRSLQRVRAAVPDEATIWPGHDYGVRPSSTVFLEWSTNPFLACESLDAFMDLKAGWAEYKLRFGLR